jgi:hypothetical protein
MLEGVAVIVAVGAGEDGLVGAIVASLEPELQPRRIAMEKRK